MTPVPTTRSPTFYRVTLLLAALGIGYCVASGRLVRYFQFFWSHFGRSAPPAEEAFGEPFTTALIWLASIAPLLYASWEIGRQHVGARRLGHGLLVGLVAVFRIALRGELPPSRAQAFARAPSDDASRAALWGGLVGALLPTFFLAAAPPLRTPRGVLWLCVAGALAGAADFFRRRAVAYLREEPRDLLRAYRLLNPDRYDPPGGSFVRRQLLATAALAVWWLAGGAFLLW